MPGFVRSVIWQRVGPHRPQRVVARSDQLLAEPPSGAAVWSSRGLTGDRRIRDTSALCRLTRPTNVLRCPLSVSAFTVAYGGLSG